MAVHPLAAVKQDRLRGLSTSNCVIAALAMDQRKSLRRMIAEAAGVPLEQISDVQVGEFKSAVTKVLTPHASAVLLDPEFGQPAFGERAAHCGLLMTYEADGYENPRPHKMLALMPHYSVRRLADLGAAGVKILLSWAPHEEQGPNEEKKALIERIGYECTAVGLPFFLEPVVYDPSGLDPKSPEFARQKPEWVIATMAEFSQERYQVDILKVEFPVNASRIEAGIFTREQALDFYRAADAATHLPYIYLSAGVSGTDFRDSLKLAAAAGARFSGVLCGRANWQDGVPAFAQGGRAALEEWLAVDGVKNIQAVNEALRTATPWFERPSAAAAPSMAL